MRTITVDTQGLYFVGKLLAAVALVVGAWNAWLPFHTYFFGETVEGATVAEAPVTKDDQDVLAKLQQLLAAAKESGAKARGSVYQYVPETGRFIAVDLVSDEVTLYDDGAKRAAYTVVHAPARDAPNALKEGEYTVDGRMPVEVSVLAMVRFPSFVSFGNGFSLHGEPTDETGAPLASNYGGGSVALTSADAAAVFAFAATGTAVHVRTDPSTPPYAPYRTLVVAKGDLPATTAKAFAVADLEVGQQLIAQNADKRYPIASITKLITAAVAGDVIKHGEQVEAPSGQYYTLGDLFYPLLLRSDNGVAQHIALHVGTANFVAAMNEYVRAAGLSVTHFADPSGLSPQDVSSPSDLLTFARYLYNNKRYILDISREHDMTITSSAGVAWSMDNQNKLAADPHFYGGKLGYTDEAGQTGLSIFNVPIDGEMHTIAVAVLGAKDWKQDTRTLLRWLLENVSVSK